MSNASERYTTSEHCIYNVSYHLIWCPKYRRPVLVNGVDTRLKTLLMEKAEELEIIIERMEVMPDHVHLFVKANTVLPVHHIINQFKGYSSRILRNEFPWLRSRLPSLWTHSYYCETIGHISEETIKRYIEPEESLVRFLPPPKDGGSLAHILIDFFGGVLTMIDQAWERNKSLIQSSVEENFK